MRVIEGAGFEIAGGGVHHDPVAMAAIISDFDSAITQFHNLYTKIIDDVNEQIGAEQATKTVWSGTRAGQTKVTFNVKANVFGKAEKNLQALRDNLQDQCDKWNNFEGN